MAKLRVHNVAISLDGYAAGPDQGLDHPLGVGGEALHAWSIATESFRRTHGSDGAEPGQPGLDDDFIRAGDENVGATIMGRNMFGPVRGPWNDPEEWTGWWGDNPPFHHPVFVLTHHPRRPVTMEGGTTFHFVDKGIEAAMDQAFEAADGRDVRIGGGPHTIRQYMRAGLVDEVHVAIVPILLGAGERLLDNLSGAIHTYECVEFVSSPTVMHVRLARR